MRIVRCKTQHLMPREAIIGMNNIPIYETKDLEDCGPLLGASGDCTPRAKCNRTFSNRATSRSFTLAPPLTHLPCKRRRAAEVRRCGTSRAKCANQRLNSSIATKSTDDQRAQEVEYVESGKQESLLVPSPPSLHSTIKTDVSLRLYIEVLVWKHCAFLDVKAQFEESRKGVGEVADTERADKTGNVTNIRHSRGDNISNRPVYRHYEYPSYLATL